MVADDPASFCIDALKLRDSLLVLVACPQVGAKSGTFIDTLAGLKWDGTTISVDILSCNEIRQLVRQEIMALFCQ